MTRSIRARILVPLLAVQAAAVASIAVAEAWLAARRAEEGISRRLDDVIGTLGDSDFPYTRSVLAKMRGLSGAHFVAVAPTGEVTESTLALTALPENLAALARRPSAARSPTVDLDGERYIAAAARAPGGAERPTLLALYPEAARRRARIEAALPPLGVGLAAMAAMAIVTGIVGDRLARRLSAIRGQVAAIAAGDFREEGSGDRGDEVDDLVASVNRMAIQLRDLRDSIRRTERASLLASLAAGLAHGLRNAATGARLAVQLHARRCPLGGTEEGLDVALRQLGLVEGQIKSLLSLGRRERRPPAVCDASELVAEVSALVGPAARHARVEFSHRGGGSLPLMADVDSLRAAVLNLALNAVEAAGPGGQASLRAEIERDGDGESVAFEVVDSGPGPPESLSESLFDPFVTGKPEGVGLGLALARQVASDGGGRLEWSRTAEGTRFRLVVARGMNA